jgi:hypothetical protein
MPEYLPQRKQLRLFFFNRRTGKKWQSSKALLYMLADSRPKSDNEVKADEGHIATGVRPTYPKSVHRPDTEILETSVWSAVLWLD